MNFPKISIMAARVNAKKTQKEAAHALGISEKTLCGYETGKKKPKWETVQAMSELYHIPMDFLIVG